MTETIAPQGCPDCGHHTSGVLAGTCSAFVPGPPGGPLAEYCGCGCYQAITGRSFMADQLSALLPDAAE